MRNTCIRKEPIPIFFAVDDRYAPYLAVALRSMIDNASKKHHYNVHILIDKLSDTNKQRLSAQQNDNFHINFVEVGKKLDAFGNMIHLRDYYTKATYYRFFIPDLFPEYSKGIYLDCDMLILGDIYELYKTDVRGLLVAAAQEEVMANVKVFGDYAEKVVGVPCEYYFNAGMLVMNLDEMRKMRIEHQFVKLLGEKAFRVTQDQDYLNLLCYGRSRLVSIQWNKTAYPDEFCFELPKIAHFKINYKPWRYNDVMCYDEFWDYAEKTEYYGDLRKEKDTYSEEEKERDRHMYSSLMELAERELALWERDNCFSDIEYTLDKVFGA